MTSTFFGVLSCTMDIYIVKHPSGRVVMFKIPPALQGVPTAWKGHWYGRNGESLGALSLREN